ncbi:MAG: acetolactate synthase small subunit [Dehalococcoidia bacterium]
MSTKHTVVALVEDRPGVLNRVASLFRRRGFNIESLAVGPTEEEGLSRMTIVVDGATTVVEQVEKQLYKLIDVVKVADITHKGVVARELCLLKVRCPNGKRSEVIQLAGVFGAKIADVSDTSVVVEFVGEEEDVDNVIRTMRPFGIVELARTGRVAMSRGASTVRFEGNVDGVAEHSRLGRRPDGRLPYVSD